MDGFDEGVAQHVRPRLCGGGVGGEIRGQAEQTIVTGAGDGRGLRRKPRSRISFDAHRHRFYEFGSLLLGISPAVAMSNTQTDQRTHERGSMNQTCAASEDRLLKLSLDMNFSAPRLFHVS